MGVCGGVVRELERGEIGDGLLFLPLFARGEIIVLWVLLRGEESGDVFL